MDIAPVGMQQWTKSKSFSKNNDSFALLIFSSQDNIDIQIHPTEDSKIAEVVAVGKILETAEDGLDLVGNLYYQDFDRVILHEKNISSEFFDLSSGLAGEVLQKFSNFRVRLAIVGDFSNYSGKSIRDFIYESKQGKRIDFVSSLTEAIQVFSMK